MEIRVLTGRIERFASVYNAVARDRILEDYNDDLRLFKSGKMSPRVISHKWAAFIGVDEK